MKVGEIVRFNQGDSLGSPILSGRIKRIWSNSLYISIVTPEGKRFVRSVRKHNGLHIGDSPAEPS